jgi:hypothetical protein
LWLTTLESSLLEQNLKTAQLYLSNPVFCPLQQDLLVKNIAEFQLTHPYQPPQSSLVSYWKGANVGH